MTKVRSREECLNAIQADSAWRKKEMSILKGRLSDREGHDWDVLLRSATVMVYAHWEGFIKTACELYLSYINELITRRGITLSRHFSDLLMWKMFRQKGEHLFVRNPVPFLEMRSQWPCADHEQIPIDVVDTEANLSSKVLKRLMVTVGIDYSVFQTKEKLIDERLLKIRNCIAHGDRVTVDRQEYEVIEGDIRALIDQFQELIEQCIQKELYLSSSHMATADQPPSDSNSWTSQVDRHRL